MTINGARRFKGNDGKSYLVQNAHKGKYNLTVKVNGVYKLCYGLAYNLLYFDSIKDAQREVMCGAEFIQTL